MANGVNINGIIISKWRRENGVAKQKIEQAKNIE
jgi:hypothetical protein